MSLQLGSASPSIPVSPAQERLNGWTRTLLDLLQGGRSLLLTGPDETAKTALLRALADLPESLCRHLPVFVYLDLAALAQADADTYCAAMHRELLRALNRVGQERVLAPGLVGAQSAEGRSRPGGPPEAASGGHAVPLSATPSVNEEPAPYAPTPAGSIWPTLQLLLDDCHARGRSVTFLLDHLDGAWPHRRLERGFLGALRSLCARPWVSAVCTLAAPSSALPYAGARGRASLWTMFQVHEYKVGGPS